MNPIIKAINATSNLDITVLDRLEAVAAQAAPQGFLHQGDITVRLSTPDDSAGISGMSHLMSDDTSPEGYGASSDADKLRVVALLHDEIIAEMVCTLSLSGSLKRPQKTHLKLFIDNIFVDAAHRRYGHAVTMGYAVIDALDVMRSAIGEMRFDSDAGKIKVDADVRPGGVATEFMARLQGYASGKNFVRKVQNQEPAPDAGPAKNYIVADESSELWEHLFDTEDGMFERNCRFVYDLASGEMTALEVQVEGAWTPASDEALSDLQTHFKDEYRSAIKKPARYGLRFAQDVPDWATPTPSPGM